MNKKQKYILEFKEISKKDVPLVGGKNASLGEMFVKLTNQRILPAPIPGKTKQDSKIGRNEYEINVPDGFALTTDAYWYFLKENNLGQKLKEIFNGFDPESIKNLQETGRKARQTILKAEFPEDLKREIIEAYQILSKKYNQQNTDVAIRSSGVAEDAPTDSFAGQFETFLNIRGENELLKAVKKCLASTFTDRVIAYRETKGFSHLEFALSIGVQKMVRSDLACSGVIFTIDTESGFSDTVVINSVWGVGEMIVKGLITPDNFYVFKPTLKQGYQAIIIKNLGRKTKKYVYDKKHGLKQVLVSPKKQLKFSLTDEEVLLLAKWSCLIEEHYKAPQDIEWAKDGKTGQLFIVQSRPETVHSSKKGNFYEEYNIKTTKKPILTGIAIGDKIGKGRVRIISDVSKIVQFQKGEVLVTKMTDPDWLPAMRIASAIITDEGGRTAHAAIVSRELGIPCIVGVREACKILKNNQIVTVDCTQGSKGRILVGEIPFEVKRHNLKKVPKLKTKIMINLGAPDIAFKTSFLPNDGVGLARIEFILTEKIRVHPLALCYYEKLKDKKLKKQIDEITIEHQDKKEFFIRELAEGIAQIAAAFYPKPVIVRLSDFKTNEYRNLVGGKLFEPEEENPMLGWRGASRYYDKEFKPAFEMECQALKRTREVFGLKNIWAMIPICRTVEEGKKVLALMKEQGLEKGKDGLKVIVMCEVPSNVILAEEFLEIFDGMSIGSNDLTQMVLALDRDNARIAHIGNEKNEAVKRMIAKVIKICRQKNKYCGICGQGPSDFPDFAEFLVKQGIETISLNPDTIIKTIKMLSRKLDA
ncbi:MAG: phosphoenolpyruvate synthase [Candidatus Nealsonbacteria bacterium]|nr:phosphoenolpyruvate synthase [Candidatus Nealsonbacteria bacterium]